MGRSCESRVRRQHGALRGSIVSVRTSGRPTSPADDLALRSTSYRTAHSTDEPFGPRVKLPPPINSDGQDYGPALTPSGHRMFFIVDRRSILPGAVSHLYVSERRNDRAPWGPRIYLDTLNCPTCFAGLPTIRAGGKEICWMGDGGDSFGDKDIYCATRR